MGQFDCPHCGGKIKYFAGQQSDQRLTTFQSVADELPEQPVIVRSFWASDAIGYSIAGAFAGGIILVFSWFYDLQLGWLAAFASLAIGVGLHVLKIVLHAPPKLPEQKPQSQVVKVEHWDDHNQHVLLDEFDQRIKFDELRRVASAIINQGANWSRPALCSSAQISQGKFHLINSEFQRLNYVFKANGNNHILTPRAKAFLRQVVNQ